MRDYLEGGRVSEGGGVSDTPRLDHADGEQLAGAAHRTLGTEEILDLIGNNDSRFPTMLIHGP